MAVVTLCLCLPPLGGRDQSGDPFEQWATSPDANPNRTEWIRLAPDSPYRDTPFGKMPHVAFLVDDLDKRLAGKEVVVGPIEVVENFRVAYFIEDGLLVEYMEGQL